MANKKHREPSEGDKDVTGQPLPRKYRQLLRTMDHYERKKSEKRLVKPNEPTKTIKQMDQEIREASRHSSKAVTKKYQKRKQWLTNRSMKSKNAQSIESQQLVDKVKFGEVALEPPKIQSKPKDRKEFIPTVTTITTAESSATVCVKRRRRLRDLPEASRIQLLQERDALIALYRSNKNKREP